MPCGYLMRVGVTKLTYWDKEGENIEVKGHKPDVDCRGKDAFEAVLQMPRDEGRILGFREKNEPVKGREVFAAYDPKAAADPRKAYYAKYLEPALARVEEENKLERNKVLAEAVDRKLRAKGIDGIGGKNGGETEAAAEKHGFAVDFYGRGKAPAEGLDQYEIIYGWCEPGDLKRATALKWYCCGFAGVDLLSDDGLYANPDVMLSNSSGAYGLTISEHILMVTLMLLRRMPDFQDIVRRREWVQELPMRSIYGSRITVLGAGDIGTNFARRAKALGAAHICGVSRSGRNGDPAYDRMLPQQQLDEVLPETEILVMALPAVADTAGILSRERIALLPREAIVVNVGRGSAIDQDALMEALNAGRIAGAALDVMVPEPLPKDHPLWSTRNLLLTPHISGNMSLGYTCDRNLDMFCRDLDNYAAGRPLEHRVDRKRGY